MTATNYTETNAEVIEKALYCLKHNEIDSVENWLDLLRERLTDDSRADALTDELIEAVAIAMHDVRRDLAKGVGDLFFDMEFAALPDEIKDVDRALARAAILAASPVEQPAAAPQGAEPPRHIVDAAMDTARREYGHGVTRASIVAIWKALRSPWYSTAPAPADEQSAFVKFWREVDEMGAEETAKAAFAAGVAFAGAASTNEAEVEGAGDAE
ncbi:hypothetical protein [Burkholderia vietnamiensis]|uniref:hypothetical protein n=1 Tax=Burkholderia vietnamiensis TaxID=60552 RepID=UPI001CF2D8FD|nr:hypothetical protein [Burkholderia vietnamiensis]MCA8198906.1 hypothetical protein [Burkholderia vietnamiensis]